MILKYSTNLIPIFYSFWVEPKICLSSQNSFLILKSVLNQSSITRGKNVEFPNIYPNFGQERNLIRNCPKPQICFESSQLQEVILY